MSASIISGKDWEIWKRFGGFRKNRKLCIAGMGDKKCGSSLGLHHLSGIPWGCEPWPEVPALFPLEEGSFPDSLIMDSLHCCLQPGLPGMFLYACANKLSLTQRLYGRITPSLALGCAVSC